jgi:hypothetical protein
VIYKTGSNAEYARDPGQQRNKRRLVHVAEREMVPRDQEVQLVLLEAIPPADRELDSHEHSSDHPDKRGHPVRRVSLRGRSR